jgi:hypothetical protein
MKIQIKLKDVYGTMKAYPADKYAETFAKMLGTKTLTRAALGHIAELGYDIEVVMGGVGVHYVYKGDELQHLLNEVA